MRLLLTNDDGPHTPLLAWAITALSSLPEISELKIAIPDSEQSWKSHAMSGHGSINPRQTLIAGHDVVLVDGTPADCVDWAMHNLFVGDEWPDLVVSGVNCGKNTGLGFVLSSATIGACLHANVAEPPRTGLALSQDFSDLGFAAAVKNGEIDPQDLKDLQAQITRHIRLTWQHLLAQQPDAFHTPLTWNVNFPKQETAALQVKETRIGDSRLEQCFQAKEGRFQHSLARYREDPSPDSDGMVLAEGHISLSPIDIRRLC